MFLVRYGGAVLASRWNSSHFPSNHNQLAFFFSVRKHNVKRVKWFLPSVNLICRLQKIMKKLSCSTGTVPRYHSRNCCIRSFPISYDILRKPTSCTVFSSYMTLHLIAIFFKPSSRERERVMKSFWPDERNTMLLFASCFFVLTPCYIFQALNNWGLALQVS